MSRDAKARAIVGHHVPQTTQSAPSHWRTVVDKPEYDRPDDDENTGNKALVFLLLAVVVVGIFYFGIYR